MSGIGTNYNTGVSGYSPVGFSYTQQNGATTPPSGVGQSYYDAQTGKDLLATLYGASSDNMTTGELIGILQYEMGKTRQAIATLQSEMLAIESNQVKAQYQDNINKLLDSAKAQQKAIDQAHTMNIVKWVLFALSILVDIATLGSASGFTAVVGSVESTVMSMMTVIPYDSKGDSLMDGITKGFQEAIECIQVDIIRDQYGALAKQQGKDLSTMSNDEVVQFAQQVLNDAGASAMNLQDASHYGAMTITLSLQVMVIVATIMVGIIAEDPGAAQGAAEDCEALAVTTIDEALDDTISVAEQEGEQAVNEASQSALSAANKAAAQADQGASVAAKGSEEGGEAGAAGQEGATNATKTGLKKVAQEGEQEGSQEGQQASKTATATTRKIDLVKKNALLQKLVEKFGTSDQIAALSKRFVLAGGTAQALGQIGMGAGSVVHANTEKQAADDQAQVTQIMGMIQFLTSLLKLDEKVLNEILAQQVTTASAVKNIIANQKDMDQKANQAIVYG